MAEVGSPLTTVRVVSMRQSLGAAPVDGAPRRIGRGRQADREYERGGGDKSRHGFLIIEKAAAPKGYLIALIYLQKNGAGEAIRTPDPNLGKVVLYP